MSILGHIDLNAVETKRTDVPVSGHTRTGYGKKVPTSLMIKLKGRWRRVYCCIFSNTGTCYVTSGKDWIVVR